LLFRKCGPKCFELARDQKKIAHPWSRSWMKDANLNGNPVFFTPKRHLENFFILLSQTFFGSEWWWYVKENLCEKKQQKKFGYLDHRCWLLFLCVLWLSIGGPRYSRVWYSRFWLFAVCFLSPKFDIRGFFPQLFVVFWCYKISYVQTFPCSLLALSIFNLKKLVSIAFQFQKFN